MRADELGERPFLESIRHLVSQIDGSVLGWDDDASDIPVPGKQNVVINVDTFVRKTDWLPGMSEAQAGRKTAVMALSDIAAKGAKPLATMLSLCFPGDYSTDAAQEIIRGFSQYCLKNGVPFIGGDLGMADDVILTAVAVGIAEPDDIVSRSGAQSGDIIAVTGYFGLTTIGYSILLDNQEADAKIRKRALQAAYKPDIHLDFVSLLKEKEAVSSAMDSSDGLAITLNTMAERSGVGFLIEKLPISQDLWKYAREQFLDERKVVMHGGEEFILVLTIPSDKWETAQDLAHEKHVSLIEIGSVEGQKGVVFETSEGYVDIPAEGYDNLREWK